MHVVPRISRHSGESVGSPWLSIVPRASVNDSVRRKCERPYLLQVSGDVAAMLSRFFPVEKDVRRWLHEQFEAVRPTLIIQPLQRICDSDFER